MTEPQTPSLYDRLGGGEAVFAVVKAFYERIMADERLSPFFAHMDLGTQIDKQVAFLTTAFGGPARFTGRELRDAHAGAVRQGLNDVHFDAVAGHLKATLEALGVPDTLVSEVMVVVESTRGQVLGR